MKKLVILFLGFCALCCTSLPQRSNEVKSKIIILGVCTNIISNSIVYICYINGEKRFLISDTSCTIDSATYHIIKEGDTIETPVFLAPKPPYSSFIPKDIMLQDHSSLFVISFTEIEDVVAIGTKDSIIADLYRSPDICNGYLRHH